MTVWSADALRVTLAAGGIALALLSAACSQKPTPDAGITRTMLPNGNTMVCQKNPVVCVEVSRNPKETTNGDLR